MAETKPRSTTGGSASANDEKKRYILTLYQDPHSQPSDRGMLLPPMVDDLCVKMDDEISASPEHVTIDLWLESSGGDAHAAYKLAVLIRAYAHRLRVVVPDWAKSAATLLALAGDEIYMAPAAELGPLDAQIPKEGGLVSSISALDIARSLDDLATSSLDIAIDRGAEAAHRAFRESRQNLVELQDADQLNQVDNGVDERLEEEA